MDDMGACVARLFSQRRAADGAECCDLQPRRRRLCRLSQLLPPLTHVTQLVRAVFCLSLHSHTYLSLHLKALSLCSLLIPLCHPCRARRCSALCGEENNRTEPCEGSITSSDTCALGLPWRQTQSTQCNTHAITQSLAVASLLVAAFVFPQ